MLKREDLADRQVNLKILPAIVPRTLQHHSPDESMACRSHAKETFDAPRDRKGPDLFGVEWQIVWTEHASTEDFGHELRPIARRKVEIEILPFLSERLKRISGGGDRGGFARLTRRR